MVQMRHCFPARIVVLAPASKGVPVCAPDHHDSIDPSNPLPHIHCKPGHTGKLQDRLLSSPPPQVARVCVEQVQIRPVSACDRTAADTSTHACLRATHVAATLPNPLNTHYERVVVPTATANVPSLSAAGCGVEHVHTFALPASKWQF